MDSRVFDASPSGRVIRTRTGYDAFVPEPLPPAIAWGPSVASAVERASLLLGELSGSLQLSGRRYLPLLLARDAVGGVRSEGRDISLDEFFGAPAAAGAGNAALRLAENYAAAIAHAQRRVDELPLSLRLIRELHFELLNGVADPRGTPGQFRRSQNWLGQPGCMLADAKFVPPPVEHLRTLLADLERFLHASDGLPALVRLSLAHCQFLVMQPFLDMNSLTFATVAPTILWNLGATSLHVPLFGRMLERHAAALLNHALEVCARGRWEEWLTWYLHCVADSARETRDCARGLQELHDEQERQAEEMEAPERLRAVLELSYLHPVMTPGVAATQRGLSTSDASDALERLTSAGILSRTSREEGALYTAASIIERLEASPMDGDSYRLVF